MGAAIPDSHHQIEVVPQPEGDAFHHGAGHVAQVVADREPDEGAPGQWIGVRGPLSGEVGEEEQTVAPGRHLGRTRHQVLERAVGGQGVSQPAETAGRRQHHSHHVPATGDRMAEGMDPSIRLHRRALGGGKYDPRSPEGEGHHSRCDCPDADGIGGLVAASGHDGRARQQPGRGGSVGANRPGDVGPLVSCGQEICGDVEGFDHLG